MKAVALPLGERHLMGEAKSCFTSFAYNATIPCLSSTALLQVRRTGTASCNIPMKISLSLLTLRDGVVFGECKHLANIRKMPSCFKGCRNGIFRNAR